jgi:fluoroquinolone resistance protein
MILPTIPEDIEWADVIDLRPFEPRRIAQSLKEMQFALSLHPCAVCGAPERDPLKMDFRGGTFLSDETLGEFRIYLQCPQCRGWRSLISWTVANPYVRHAKDELNGPLPSNILQPMEFLGEIDRLVPAIAEHPQEQGYKEWSDSMQSLRRAILCANELAKFLPPGASKIPDDLLYPESADHQRSHPDRYSASYISSLQKQLAELFARYQTDLPRYKAQRAAEEPPPKLRVGEFTEQSVRAHRAWEARGMVGEGRMVLKNHNITDIRLPVMEGFSWEGVSISRARGKLSGFIKAELIETTWSECALEGVTLDEASLIDTTFVSCNMQIAHFARSKALRCRFERCLMDRSLLEGCQWERVELVECEVYDLNFRGASLKHCSFRGQHLCGTKSFGHLAKTAGARFEDCDFRDTRWLGRDLSHATFVRCQLAGATGRPVAHEGLVLEDCDVTREQLLAMLAA